MYPELHEFIRAGKVYGDSMERLMGYSTKLNISRQALKKASEQWYGSTIERETRL